ncbi:flagellar hook-associated protein FlgL [Domibacillus sp. PGB-M46]|uniref:flagellar hook-associated protein FlgL n=1 Tax=Domibacillus sp. PGB-M46 TaxID=2910255 RepID=UPI001F59123D|nr:flagellar hook-associated protein FlgL [Domibacillus sp. PGB-M46]MCI2253004.1 flagellar hook-associated protein FlgL [Domibacillus sp. PGB-M46]
MRVTQSMLTGNMMKNLTSSMNRLDTLNTQVATQKKISRPSDDPVVAMKGMNYRRSLQEVEQFQRNFSEAYNWVENSDETLDKAKLAMDRVRELLVQTSNDTYDAEQRQSAKAEVDQLKEHLIELANTKFGEKYLFNGTNTLEQPVDEEGTVAATNKGKVKIELSEGVYIQVNVDAGSAFSQALFDDMDAISKAMADPATTGEQLSAFLTNIDSRITENTTARAEIGARFNRIELMQSRLSEQEVVASRILSDNEDVDFEKVVTELTAQETVHRAALSVGARIIQPSLMDFLR